MKTIYWHRLNKGFGLKFPVSSRVQQETPEEGRRAHQPKCREYNNKDADNNLNTVNNKNVQSSIHVSGIRCH